MSSLQSNLTPQWPMIFAKLASAISIIVGMTIILGWIFYFWLPENLIPFVIAFKPNTALCFILAGISLWLASENSRGYARTAGEICAAVVFLIPFLTLFEYFFEIDLGIDQGLFTEPLAHAETFSPPGRMSPFSATNFILVGFVLYFLDNKLIKYQVHQFLIIIALFTCLFELLGHLYQIGSLARVFGLTSNIQVGLPVVATFLILELGVLLVRPYQGVPAILVNRNSGGVFARRLIPTAIFLPILLGYLGLIGKWFGVYDTELGMSFLVISTIVFFVAFLLFNSHLINIVDNERKQVARALKLNQVLLQAILDHTSAVVYIYDLEGKFLLVNKQFEKLTHKSAGEIIGKKTRDIFPKEFADKIEENNQQVLQSRVPIAVEEPLPDKKNIHIYLANKFPLFNEQGLPYAIGGISTEITEIKRMHEVLRENEENLVLALQSASAGTWSWDINKDEIAWDAYMYQLFGLKPGSFPGQFRAALSLVHPEDRKRVNDEVNKALETGTEFETEFRIIHTDGSIKYLSARGKVHRDNKGRPVRMAGVCLETTQRKHAEEELRRAKEIAEHLAEKAEDANHAKSAFLAAMSHEIRTPLNGVIGMTGLLLDTPLSSEQRESVETIRISGEALLSVINDILDFSKIESERMELENTDFDLHVLIQDTVEILSSQVHRKGIALGAYIEENVPEWVTGDPSRVRQVLANLLSNAAKFTEKGEISIKVKLVKKIKKQCIIMFEVIDTGIGIPPEILERLFQPFSQGDISTSRKFGGTGLGLAISKRLVEIMRGNIGVESSSGRGSRFWFTVQLTECTSPAPKLEYRLSPELKGIRILCIDDNAINREIIKRQTEAWQLRCDVAMNAAEALSMLKKAAIEKDPYKLGLVDYLMPGMNGFELIQIIRQLKEIADTPVMILSSMGSTFTEEELKQLGIAMSLTKPIRPNKLYECIAKVLNSYKAADSSHPFIKDEQVVEKKNFRILLAEDNPINQQVALRILAKLGYRADTVGNGIEAMEAVKKVPYDLILMDCQMPEMDGYTATEEIRRYEKSSNRRVPIIAMTAHALKGDREKCLAVGMNDYISKPIDVSALKTILNKWLEEKDTQEPNPQEPVTENTENKAKTNSINYDRIKEIFGDDTAAIKQFLQAFIDSTSLLLREIENAIKNKNAKAAKDFFHRLKGSAGNRFSGSQK